MRKGRIGRDFYLLLNFNVFFILFYAKFMTIWHFEFYYRVKVISVEDGFD